MLTSAKVQCLASSHLNEHLSKSLSESANEYLYEGLNRRLVGLAQTVNALEKNALTRAVTANCLALCLISLAHPVTLFDIPVARYVDKRRVDKRDQHFKKGL